MTGFPSQLNLFNMNLNLTRPLAVFDLETTGTNIALDRIVEIAVLKIQPDQTEEALHQRINPEIHIPEEATLIHGISDQDVKDSPTFKDFAHVAEEFLQGCDLSGYNAIKFDIPILAEEFLRAGIEFSLMDRNIIDVQNIFHKMEPRTLKAAYRFYCGMELVDNHSAEADTRATFEILKAQLDRYEGTPYTDPEGIVSKPVVNDMKALNDFSYFTRNVDLVGHIVFNDKQQEVFNFGKYKGRSVEEVFRREPAYFDWMMKSQFPLSTKRVIQAIKLRI
jgi:DNA polymerase-3 subunit epsilon